MSGRQIVMENPDGRDPIASLLFWRGLAGWEPETTAVFLRLLTPDSVVLDVGANTGLFSLLAGDADPSIQVHAFEPVSGVFSLLNSNVELNALRNVTAHEMALVDQGGTVTLYIPKGAVPVMSSIQPGWAGGPTEARTVIASTVDVFMSSNSSGRVSMMKIDVEGAEHAVLRGAAETIARDRPFIICEILSAADGYQETFDVLRAADYHCFHLTTEGPRSTGDRLPVDSDCKNYLFVPASQLPTAMALLNLEL